MDMEVLPYGMLPTKTTLPEICASLEGTIVDVSWRREFNGGSGGGGGTGSRGGCLAVQMAA
jgi:hypothetical protein